MNDDGLFSVDNLVEFGIGMAMARQMVDMFNRSMPDLSQSSVGMPCANNEVQYFIGVDGKPAGPIYEAELVSLIQRQSVNKDTLVWTKGMPEWKPIQDVPSILKLIALNS